MNEPLDRRRELAQRLERHQMIGALGLFGVAAIAGQIAWMLFFIGVVLIVHLASGRRVPLP